MRRIKFAVVVIAGVALVGCTSTGQGEKQTGGAVVGAALGGLLGSTIGRGGGRVAATVIGALAGAYVGSEVGKSLDRADRKAMEQSTQTALENNPTHQTAEWNNPDSGNKGTVTPTRTYQTAEGKNCREYQQTVTIDGKTERAYGTACREPDGSWRIAN